jgi:hypothetical protein
MPHDPRISILRTKVATYGKENQGELLYSLAEGARMLAGSARVRIYLEDLTRGVLSCVHVSGTMAEAIREHSFPIISTETVVSRVFVSQYPVDFRAAAEPPGSPDSLFAEEFDLSDSYIMPVVSLGKSIGVLCIDDLHGSRGLNAKGKSLLADLSGFIADRLDQARIYHQQVQLARRLEELKAREVAGMMVASAVRLIEKLSLASVLVPVHPRDTDAGELEILASYSGDEGLKALYDQQGAIDLKKGSSLISRYVDDQAVISDERMLKPLFISDLTQHSLQKPALTESMALRSMYVVPRFNPVTRRVICLVNYFSRDLYRFSDFEMGLLQTHAEMVERVISEVGGEHLEISVLSEITELLNESTESLQPFLTKVLSKATELIGADTGSIAVVAERDGVLRLVVEDENGIIVGAKG